MPKAHGLRAYNYCISYILNYLNYISLFSKIEYTYSLVLMPVKALNHPSSMLSNRANLLYVCGNVCGN